MITSHLLTPLILLTLFLGCNSTEVENLPNKPKVDLNKDAVDESAGDLPCYKITTSKATYFLEKEGGGLSSLLDRDGNDWISFHEEKGSGAKGEYRGFPNAVFRQDGSFFHPKNAGTDPSVAEVVREEPERVTIHVTSGNGNWEAMWDFYPTHCTFTMLQMPADYNYWILYEGVPGGQYNDGDWYMTSSISEKRSLTQNHEGDIPAPEWITFGDHELSRSLVLYNHQDDTYPDHFYQMEKSMTVFGFGRAGTDLYLNEVPRSFSIGLVETTDHNEIASLIQTLMVSNQD